jgi:hypothetical protein
MSVFPATHQPPEPREPAPAQPVESQADCAAREWLERMRLRHPIHFVVERNSRD